MAKLGTLTLTGASGATYDFTVYSHDTTFKENVDCVYYVSKRTLKPDGGGTHTKIYIGETDDLNERLSNHHKQMCFDRHGYNAISVHREASSSARLKKESDLIAALDPPCNG